MAEPKNHGDREAQRILNRVQQESDPSGSLAARATKKMREHVAAGDADHSDWIELWGTRIGRVLGLVLLVVLLVSLARLFVGA